MSIQELEKIVSDYLLTMRIRDSTVVTPDNQKTWRVTIDGEIDSQPAIGDAVTRFYSKPYENAEDLPYIFYRHLMQYLKENGSTRERFILAEKAQISIWIEQLENLNPKSKWLLHLEAYRDYIKSREGKNDAVQNKKTFESKLNDTHLEQIIKLVTEIKLFKENIDLPTLRLLFEGKLNKPLQVNNNQILATLFNNLQLNSFVTPQWQSVAQKTGCFVGIRGKSLTAKNLSASLKKAGHNTDASKKIAALMKVFQSL